MLANSIADVEREREREQLSECITSFVLKGQSQALDLKLK